MNARSVLIFIAKVLLLTALIFVLFTMGSMQPALLALQEPGIAQDPTTLPRLLLVLLGDVLLLAWLILRARWTGWRLILLLAVTFYAVKTILGQMETWYFIPSLRGGTVEAIVRSTLPAALLWPPIAVWLFGRWRPFNAPAPVPGRWPDLGVGGWAWRLALLAVVVYPLLFFGFGYYVAWQDPAVRAYYGGGDLLGFIPHMRRQVIGDPVVYPFEVLRGLLWVLVALPILRAWQGKTWELALYVGLLFALMLNMVHFLPNPAMPPGPTARCHLRPRRGRARASAWPSPASRLSRRVDERRDDSAPRETAGIPAVDGRRCGSRDNPQIVPPVIHRWHLTNAQCPVVWERCRGRGHKARPYVPTAQGQTIFARSSQA